MFGGLLRLRRPGRTFEPYERSWPAGNGRWDGLPVLMVKLSRLPIVRTGEYDSLPWSYRCNACHTWGHGYATENGARKGRGKHHCKRLQYNERRDS